MTYVYLLATQSAPSRHYIGKTSNLKQRLSDHNAGRSHHTAASRPWRLVTYHAFSDPWKARDFESYLKSGSGRTFAFRHLW